MDRAVLGGLIQCHGGPSHRLKRLRIRLLYEYASILDRSARSAAVAPIAFTASHVLSHPLGG